MAGRAVRDPRADPGFCYRIHGHPLRSALYPPRTVLYRRKCAKYQDEGHGHRVSIDGKVEKLFGRINHDDRKPLSHWIQAQDRYALREAQHLLKTRKAERGLRNLDTPEVRHAESVLRRIESPKENLSFQDRLRLKIFFAAPAMFLYLLFGKGLILDGWHGWYYVMQRTIAEMLLSVRLLTEREGLEDKAEMLKT